METKIFGGVPVNLFLPEWDLESGALEQIIATSQHPHVIGKVAVMPDAHQGYGVSIGTVFSTEGVIVPNAVGVDIGCGVTFVNTGVNFFDLDADFFREYESKIRSKIPVGFNWHKDVEGEHPLDEAVLRKYARHPDRVALQFGTLGGGNHFLELLRDSVDRIWIAVHSGSRGFGHNVAEYFQKIAVEENAGGSKNLESLSLRSGAGTDYLFAMNQATLYASASRHWMIQTMRETLWGMVGRGEDALSPWDVPHNYAIKRYGSVVTHRKGAIDASLDKIGIIPGSMGSPTYFVVGRGNPESLQSASHGAGRVMSRSKAKVNVSLEEFQAALSDTYSTASVHTLDESPQAYKDIDTVIERQRDLVTVVEKLHPVLTIKGGGRDEG